METRIWSNGTRHVVDYGEHLAAWDDRALVYFYSGSSDSRRAELWDELCGPPGDDAFSAMIHVGGATVLQIEQDRARIVFRGEQTSIPGRIYGRPTRSQWLMQTGEELVIWDTRTRPFAPIGSMAMPDAITPSGMAWLVRRGAIVERIQAGTPKPLVVFTEPDERTYEGWVDVHGLHVEHAAWSGRPGAFEVSVALVHRGSDLPGLYLRILGSAHVDRVTLGQTTQTVSGGIAAFPHAGLVDGGPETLTLRGTALATSEIVIELTARRYEPLDIERAPERAPAIVEVDLTRFRIALTVESDAMRAVRGEVWLDLDPAWVAELERLGVLDVTGKAPDLKRWVRRALSRCRVDSVSDDPDGVLAEWLRISERDRAATGVLVPAYKFASAEHWILSAAEAAQIRRALGVGHPLGAFADGEFTVQSASSPLS